LLLGATEAVITYDPQSLGADCARCPLRALREGAPVPPEFNSSITVVAQCPGYPEVEKGRPFAGPFGIELNRALKTVGLSRSSVSQNHAVACMPPQGDYRAFIKGLEKANKTREKQGHAKLPTPAECCRPRLRAELATSEGVIPIGATAAHSVLGGNAKIMDLRGQLLTTETGLKVVPTVANVLYARRFRRVFLSDIARAVRWFLGKLPWTPPRVTYSHAYDRDGQCIPLGAREGQVLDQIEAFLAVPRDLWCADIETVATVYNDENKPVFDPRRDLMRCFGFGDRMDVFVVHVVSIKRAHAFPLGIPLWTREGLERLARIMFAAFMDGRLWIGHNFGSYDTLALRNWFRQLVGLELAIPNLFDTLMAVRVVDPELPKGLGFCTTIHLEEGTPDWKGAETATEAKNDEELAIYNGLDVAINARLAPVLAKQVAERNQQTVLAKDHEMQAVTVGLHEQGLLVNQTTRGWWAFTLTMQMEHHNREIIDALVDADAPNAFGREGLPYNPNSPFHVREVLFEHFDLAPPSTLKPKEVWTDSGDRSTAKTVLNAYLADPNIEGPIYDFIEAQRRYKKASKLYGTYVAKADPTHGKTVMDLTTGRIHAEWKAHTTLPGRLACARPNLLNQPKKLRNMYEAAEGHCYVGADWSAIHLYIIAERWNIPSLLEAFHAGLDAHALFAGVVFGDRFWNADGLPDGPRGTVGEYTGNAGKMRAVTKTVRYAGAYMAVPETIWRVVRATEDKRGNLPYKKMKMGYIHGIHTAWMKGEPQWQAAWEAEIAEWKINGFKFDPILGRRCDFADGVVQEDGDTNIGNALVNFPILSAEAAIANIVTTELVKAIPFGYAGPGTGLVQQNYDSFLLEVPKHDVPRVSGILYDLMNFTPPGMTLRLKADVATGQTWDKV
jgi:DNA polymerase I-like protein with 3'-5' exonuclease and polymerase domains/uracil-DNA glycosylase